MESSILKNFYQRLQEGAKKERAVAVGIKEDGTLFRDVLDEKPYNHAIAFNFMARDLGISYQENWDSFTAAENLKNHGVLAMQIDHDIESESGFCMCYFPEQLSKHQYESLKQELDEKEELLYQYKEDTMATKEEVLEYALSLTSLELGENNIRRR